MNSRVILRPGDRTRTTAFYRDTLGLAVAREFPGGTVFFCGQGYLEVSGEATEGPGETSLWFQVTDLAATHRELLARGVTVDREPRCEPWGLHEMWLRDPDGVRIVVVQVPEEHPIRRDTRTPD
ncbi:catechol 2,3-dioxygenase-like lactoylglutathione lyase family enzyme [Crossiella equi]|uniref:Catechol 2,3-dioxygenase-like lactoylglutathione lyase family enzyme n=1 Tax=Crossiella equi TaxID=130796 RepID=A0ABS5AMZ9_9PSEU|nr:catechol 2,3-dioxygenase-like lactoylglutathione lyase family enzyme [Crossiella equi]